MRTVTIEDLKNVVALSELPDEHLQWILDRSEYSEYEDGTQIKKTGDEADVMIIVMEGKISFYYDYNGRLVYYFYYSNDVQTGGVGGLIPYSRMKVYPGCSFAGGHLRCLKLHKKYFPELEHLNPEFIQRLIGYMTERAKSVATTQSHQEKVSALGQLAAGIAHEMNNPAAAIMGISEELSKRLNRNYQFTKSLLACRISPEQIENVRQLVSSKENTLSENKPRTTLERMEIEEEIEEWLEENGISAKETAETFSEFQISLEELKELHKDLGNEAFPCIIPWLENLISSRKILKDLNHASSRISDLVSSIKSHVHMDRTNDLVPTNIQKDIENTLTLLGFKIREKDIKVIKNFADNMPDVPAYVSDLNQVWTNLIDNALSALSKNGTLTVETSRDDKNILVSIIDNGSGISDEVMPHIFEPFFTTKKMGEGSGMGLDIIKRIIKHHNGDIKVKSQPGRTEFSVSLPMVQKPASN